MKKLNLIYILCIIIAPAFFYSCSKNSTQYYGDDKDTGISIFTNKGLNTMSCYVNSSPWRTIERTEGGFYYTRNYEVYVSILAGQNGNDTLQISWLGNFANILDPFQGSYFITAKFTVPHSFSYPDFSSLQGKKLTLDGTNGYFSAPYQNPYTAVIKGTGNIYFNRAQLDSISLGNNNGIIAGLFDADISGFKITNGRFDNNLDGINAVLAR